MSYSCFIQYDKMLSRLELVHSKLGRELAFFYYSCMLEDLLKFPSLLASFFRLQTCLTDVEIICFCQSYQDFLLSETVNKEVSQEKCIYKNDLSMQDDFSILYYEISNFLFLVSQVKSSIEKGIPITELYIWPTLLVALENLSIIELVQAVSPTYVEPIVMSKLCRDNAKITIIEKSVVFPYFSRLA